MAERCVALKHEYEQGWRAHHELLSENFLPFGGRFFIDDRNIGDRRHGSIIDSTPLHAARTLSAGLVSGATSPARIWFRIRIKDVEANEDPAIQEWLSDTNEVIRAWINTSNLYLQLHRAYAEMAVFGTAVILLLPDDDTLMHAYGATAGQYYLATNAKDVVNVYYHEFQMTVTQVVREFGYENCSEEVQQAFDAEKFEQEVHVVHAIEPNDERYVEGSSRNDQLRYRSIYFEFSSSSAQKGDRKLREGGFDVFPVLVFRWDTAGGDVYGNGPGMEALGDAIQLQHEQERKGQGIDYQTRPPLQLPPGLKHHEVDGEPAGMTTVPNAGRDPGVRPLFETRIDLTMLREDIEDVRMRLRRTMFTDLFLMMQELDKSMTAREAIIRDSEKLLMLGPMLEGLFGGSLKAAIDLIFYYITLAGDLPEPPPQLADADLDVEFVSPLAQAQRGIGINAVDRLLQTLGAIAGMKPDVLDVLDEDEVARTYARDLGVDPDLLHSEEMTAMIREARAKQQAAMQQAEALQQVTAAQKNAADAAAAAPVDAITQSTGYLNPNAVPSS
jgi:hypothetical protein